MPRRASSRLVHVLGLLPFLSGPGCGTPDIYFAQDGRGGLLELLAPPQPLGLHYGERVPLLLRYLLRDRPERGVELRLSIYGDPGGATLSSLAAFTDDRGEAHVDLTAGAAEAEFRVQADALYAAGLSIDVAVSRRSFGSLGVGLDAGGRFPGAVAVSAALYADLPCSQVHPAPKPEPPLRSLSAPHPAATLFFGNLLLRNYTVLGRAEDVTARLLGFGCAEVPEQALTGAPESVLQLPLQPVYPDPLGRYDITSTLAFDPLGPIYSAYAKLACPAGVGQALLDALIAALPAGEGALAAALAAQRGPADLKRCRPPAVGGTPTPDGQLDALLAAPGSPGQKLRGLATDLQSLQRGLELGSRLTVRAPARDGLWADHELLTATLRTRAQSTSYDLGALGLPVLRQADLLLPLDLERHQRVSLPRHGLTLRLPALWRRALADLVETPQGIRAAQLLPDAVAAAELRGSKGCDAVQALLCAAFMGLGLPCGKVAGTLAAACRSGQTALLAELAAALADGPAGLDFYLAGTFFLSDPEGTLKVQALDNGQLGGSAALASGAADLGGPSRGTRASP